MKIVLQITAFLNLMRFYSSVTSIMDKKSKYIILKHFQIYLLLS